MTKDLLKYFMWEYQEHYRFYIQRYADILFGEISQKLKPNVFLIGFLRKDAEGYQPICIEPEKCGVDVARFQNVDDLAKSIYDADPRKNIFHTEPNHHQRVTEDLKTECLCNAVKQLVDKNFEDKSRISFVSFPVMLDNYEIFIVIQFDKDNYNSFHSLVRSEVKIHELRTTKVWKLLVDALVHVYLNEATDVLYRPRPGVYMECIRTDKKELLRIAASNFIGTVIPAASGSQTTYDMFDICNYISSLKYEGDSSIGKLLICKEDHPNIDIVLRLKTAVQLKDYRRVRKLLEITSENLHLYSNGDDILGLAKLKNVYDAQKEDLFVVNFNGTHKWELVHNKQTIMLVEYTNPSLPKMKINKIEFDDLLKRTFENISDENLKKILDFVNISTKQKHGTLIIISNEAKSETERLGQQSTNIEPMMFDDELIENVTSMDGAIMIDTCGTCHSIGVILDGIATPKGNPARGARFNSAVRYVEMKEKNCVAVIISEDGMVDLYPKLKPQIRKSEIIERLEQLRNKIDKDKVDYDEFRPLMNWFEKYQFYLSQEECNEINELKVKFNSKFEQESNGIYIVYHDLKPNPEMNESYFVNEGN